MIPLGWVIKWYWYILNVEILDCPSENQGCPAASEVGLTETGKMTGIKSQQRVNFYITLGLYGIHGMLRPSSKDDGLGQWFALGFYSLSGKAPTLVKSRSREIGCYNDRIALKFDMHLGSVAAEVPVKFQSSWTSINPNLAPSRLNEILQYDVRPLSE